VLVLYIFTEARKLLYLPVDVFPWLAQSVTETFSAVRLIPIVYSFIYVFRRLAVLSTCVLRSCSSCLPFVYIKPSEAITCNKCKKTAVYRQVNGE